MAETIAAVAMPPLSSTAPAATAPQDQRLTSLMSRFQNAFLEVRVLNNYRNGATVSTLVIPCTDGTRLLQVFNDGIQMPLPSTPVQLPRKSIRCAKRLFRWTVLVSLDDVDRQKVKYLVDTKAYKVLYEGEPLEDFYADVVGDWDVEGDPDFPCIYVPLPFGGAFCAGLVFHLSLTVDGSRQVELMHVSLSGGGKGGDGDIKRMKFETIADVLELFKTMIDKPDPR